MRKSDIKKAASTGRLATRAPRGFAQAAEPEHAWVADADARNAVYRRAGADAASEDLATAADDAIDALPEGAPLPPVHPGEILLEEFIRPYNLTPIRTAHRLGVPRTRIERLVAGATAVTEDTALRLERLFGASAEFWLRLQADYDLVVARRQMDPSIEEIEPLARAG